MKFLLKWPHYYLNPHCEWEKFSFDDFLMMTWQQEVESQRKKEAQIPHLSPLLPDSEILRPVVPYLKLDIHFSYEISQKQIIVHK